MKKLILILVCFLGFYTLSAKEQTIIIKTSGGAERQVLDKNDKPTGETFIGYNNFFASVTAAIVVIKIINNIILLIFLSPDNKTFSNFIIKLDKVHSIF